MIQERLQSKQSKSFLKNIKNHLKNKKNKKYPIQDNMKMMKIKIIIKNSNKNKKFRKNHI